RDDVGVPFDDDCALLSGDRGARKGEPVQEISLSKELSFGGVDVLRAQGIVLAELPRLEPENPSARVCEWEQEATREVVVSAAVCGARRGSRPAHEDRSHRPGTECGRAKWRSEHGRTACQH